MTKKKLTLMYIRTCLPHSRITFADLDLQYTCIYTGRSLRTGTDTQKLIFSF